MPLAIFLAQGLLAHEEKLGPMLWQFPERMRLDHALLVLVDAAAQIVGDADVERAGEARQEVDVIVVHRGYAAATPSGVRRRWLAGKDGSLRRSRPRDGESRSRHSLASLARAG